MRLLPLSLVPFQIALLPQTLPNSNSTSNPDRPTARPSLLSARQPAMVDSTRQLHPHTSSPSAPQYRPYSSALPTMSLLLPYINPIPIPIHHPPTKPRPFLYPFPSSRPDFCENMYPRSPGNSRSLHAPTPVSRRVVFDFAVRPEPAPLRPAAPVFCRLGAAVLFHPVARIFQRRLCACWLAGLRWRDV
ncbi:uncharacterized protein J3D65DRAFT_631256 [Phyllosticta citribraziliensis]|uniref:Uncharacterized protein n=1 Tax=Phyllosticta citribraziliensis TaxID=989973 RepID=A0ABR1LEW7_9PEZI